VRLRGSGLERVVPCRARGGRSRRDCGGLLRDREGRPELDAAHMNQPQDDPKFTWHYDKPVPYFLTPQGETVLDSGSEAAA
jgi:hypothetical protein